MNIADTKRFMDDKGYTLVSDNRFRNICDIYYMEDNGTDLFVIYFDKGRVASKNNICHINDAIRKNEDFYVGNNPDKKFLNIVKVGSKKEIKEFRGKDIYVSSPEKDFFPECDTAFDDIIKNTKTDNKVKALTKKKYKTMQGVFDEKDRISLITGVMIASCIYIYIRYFGKADLFAVSPMALKNGQLMKVISSMFMHGSITHIICNMAALYSYGSALEKREGHISMLITYMVSGMCAMFGTAFISLMFGRMDTSTVGASGAIYGVIGAYIVSEHLMPKGFKNPRALIKGTVYMLAMSAIMPGIDNTCHVVGIISGMLTMLTIKVAKKSAEDAKYGIYSKRLMALGKDFMIPGKANW